MTPLVVVVLAASHILTLVALNALEEVCRPYVRTTENFQLYHIAEEIQVEEIGCSKKVVKQKTDCFTDYSPTAITSYTIPFENCTKAISNKIYEGYRIQKLNSESLVDQTNNECTYVKLIKLNHTAYLVANRVLVQSDIRHGSCDYKKGMCNDSHPFSWVTWDIRQDDPSELPPEKYVYKFASLHDTKISLLELGTKYAIFEQDSHALALEITKKSYYNENTTILHLGNSGLILSDKSIINTWDSRFGSTLPRFNPKEEIYDNLTSQCQLYRLEKQNLNQEKKTMNQLNYLNVYPNSTMADTETEVYKTIHRLRYIVYGVAVVVSCTVLYLVGKTFKRLKKQMQKNTNQLVNSERASDVQATKQPTRNVYEYITTEYNINELYNNK